MIYADNAATTKLDIDVFEGMKPFLLDQYANASQPYSFSRTVKKALKEARQMIAECINAEPQEIYFTSGGTESDNWAIKSSMAYGDFRTVITSEFEHHAILHACRSIEKMGYPVSYLHPNSDGFITPEILSAAIKNETKMVSVIMVNNEIGTIQPIKELCAIAHKHNAVFHTDAVQAVGHLHIDVKELDVDMLSSSAHKFHGPKGIGFLYVKKGTPIVPYADGGEQEFGMRAGTENIASIVGMAIALQKSCASIDYTIKKLTEFEQIIVKGLQTSGIEFIKNGGNPHLMGNISLSIKGVSGEMLLHRMDLKGICISTGSACDSTNTQISHVIKSIGVPEDFAKGTVRISLGNDNTEEEANKIAKVLISILKK